jgi:hypothetical protein
MCVPFPRNRRVGTLPHARRSTSDGLSRVRRPGWWMDCRRVRMARLQASFLNLAPPLNAPRRTRPICVCDPRRRTGSSHRSALRRITRERILERSLPPVVWKRFPEIRRRLRGSVSLKPSLISNAYGANRYADTPSRFPPGGAVDRRTISSGVKTIVCTGLPPRKRASRTSMVDLPIASFGWETTVKGGSI